MKWGRIMKWGRRSTAGEAREKHGVRRSTGSEKHGVGEARSTGSGLEHEARGPKHAKHGVTKHGVTKHGVRSCEARGQVLHYDILAIDTAVYI
jgi:hypothetical protein